MFGLSVLELFLTALEGTATALHLHKLKGWAAKRWTKWRQEVLEHEQDDFKDVRSILKSERTHLAKDAALIADYRDAVILHFDDDPVDFEVPFLAHPEWIPANPIPILPPEVPASDLPASLCTQIVARPGTGSPFEANKPVLETVLDSYGSLMPRSRKTGLRFPRYTDAIEEIAHPDLRIFESRPSYRLLNVRPAPAPFTMDLTSCRYFDFQNTCEVLCHEFARARRSFRDRPLTADGIDALWQGLSVRRRTGAWDDFTRRLAIPGVNNLTILKHSSTQRTFIMMQRGNKAPSTEREVMSAMGTLHVIPAGEFQPSSKAEVTDECSIWYTLIREFAEEIGLMTRAESHELDALSFRTTDPLEKITDPVIQRWVQYYSQVRRDVLRGTWKSYFLGIGVDPLSLKPEILTATVIDWKALRGIVQPLHQDFLSDLEKDTDLSSDQKAVMRKWVVPGGGLPAANNEGSLVRGEDGSGFPLTRDNLRKFVGKETTLPAAMACLTLVNRHLEFFNNA